MEEDGLGSRGMEKIGGDRIAERVKHGKQSKNDWSESELEVEGER